MKQITSTLQRAIVESDGSRLLVKAVFDQSRTFFSTPTYNNPYDVSDYSVITDTPVGQCMIYSGNMGKSYTFIVDSSTGGVYCMQQDSSTKNSLGITANKYTKPSALDMGNGTALLYYWNDDPSGLYVTTVNLTTFATSDTTEIVVDYVPSAWSVIAGSPTVLDENRLVLCYKTSKGGVGIGFLDGNIWKHWEQRFLSANRLTETAWTIYTTAAIKDDKLFVYSTDVDTGVVRGIEYSFYKEMWSDIYIALTADISRFCVCNAVVSNGYIHLSGQFHRTDDLVAAKIYSLVLRSENGRNFSWDRFTLLSNLGYQFQVAIDVNAKKVYASDRNCVGVADMSYFWTPITTSRITLGPPDDILTFESNLSQGVLQVKAADEVYYEHTVIDKSNRVMVSLGYETEVGEEYELFGTFIIDSKQTIFKDGVRSVVLQLTEEGIWKTGQIAFPFYAELLSKTSQFDNCDEADKTYPVAHFNGKYLDYLTVDFWNSTEWDGDGVVSGENFTWKHGTSPAVEFKLPTNDSGSTDQLRARTCTLTEHPYLTDYPRINNTTATMRLYGWERTESEARPNSTWTLYAVTAPADDLDTKTVTTGTCTSSYQKFPRDYPSSQSGSYPIVFSFTGLTLGHVLLYVGLTVSNSTAGTSWSLPERIEIDGVQFAYSQFTSNTNWTPEEAPSGSTYLKNPETGLPNLMFTTKPYSAFNFNVSAEFEYSAGASPLSVGETSWGVVGLAKDGFDFFMARYKRQSSQIELVLMRDGYETILTSYTPGIVPYDIMLDHRNGLFRVWYKNSGVWVGPVISYTYDEITSGIMSTSETGIMHTGVMAAVFPPGFICPSFSPSRCDGVMATTEMDDSIFDGFPASGTVLINGVQYLYASKTKNTAPTKTLRYGPYQLRQCTNIGTWTEGGVTYSGVGLEIALYKPNNAYNAVAGLHIGQSNGSTWLITKSDWTVTHSTNGQPDYLRHRSKHYSNSAVDDSGECVDKCYIGHGLTGLTVKSGQSGFHPVGALVSVYGTDEIWVKKIVTTQIDNDATVKDMLSLLCASASIGAVFPGDLTMDTLTISSAPQQFAPDKVLFPGGCDVKFTIPPLDTDGDFIAVYGDNLLVGDNSVKLDIGIKNDAGNLVVYLEPKSGTDFAESLVVTQLSPYRYHDIRILIHGDFVSVYGNNTTLATFALGVENLEWADDSLQLYIYANSTYEISTIVLSELFDWREAIYIESEMSAASAISSVIQERPVEINPTRNGEMLFSYKFERDRISYSFSECLKILRMHSFNDGNVDNAGSDAIVYYADITYINHDNYAIDNGFNTRVFKLFTLDYGAKLAGKIILDKAFEKQKMHSLEIRPDIRIDIGDILNFNYIVPNTNRNVTITGITESLSVSLKEGSYAMRVTMRDYSYYQESKINAYMEGA